MVLSGEPKEWVSYDVAATDLLRALRLGAVGAGVDRERGCVRRLGDRACAGVQVVGS